MTLIILSLAGLAIIGGLSAYAFVLLKRVKEIKAQQLEELATAEMQIRQHQQELINDIKFIARAVVSEQCDITEGVLRTHHMIKGLDADVWEMAELDRIRNHYDATCEMPIMDAYRKLTKQEQFQLDIDRAILEEKNKTGVHREFTWLTQYQFPQITLLQ